MYKVTVLMSTFCGEQFLEEQLKSLLRQSDIDLKILVRDDDSNDNTIDIIKKYAMKYNNVTFYVGRNVGAAKSFMDLIKNVPLDSDFYAFCDQDDVWDQDKISIAVQHLIKESGPVIYTCKKRVTDENLSVLYESGQFDAESKLCSLARESALTGCTMVFNASLMELLKRYEPKDVIMHDAWVRDVCCCVGGKIIFDSVAHMSYRQHGKNVVGGKKDLISRLSRMKKNTQRLNGAYMQQWKELKNGYYPLMRKNEKEVLDLCLSYKDSFAKKMALLRNQQISGHQDYKRYLFLIYKVITEKL